MHENPQRSIELLTKLATHLRSDKRIHPIFDFQFVSNRLSRADLKPAEGYTCGTAGCAVGEFPAVFPETFEFRQSGLGHLFDVCVKGQEEVPYFSEMAADFLGLSGDEAYHLFAPNEQNTERFGGQDLGNFASASEVADNIDDFIEVVLKPQVRNTNG